MNRCPALILAALALLAAPPARSQDAPVPEPEEYSVRLELRGWLPTLKGELQASGSKPGTLIDAKKNLGVEDTETFEARVAVQLGLGKKLRAGYTPLDYGGTKDITKEIIFDDTVYPRFTHLVSSLSGGYYSGDFEWDFATGPYGYAGAIFGARVWDVDALLVAPIQGDRDVETFRLPIPVLGLVGRACYGHVAVSGELAGISIGDRGSLWELHLGSHLTASRHLGLMAGYRLVKLHTEPNKGDLVDMKMSGLHFGVELSF